MIAALRVLFFPSLLKTLARENYFLESGATTRRDPFRFFTSGRYLMQPMSLRLRMICYLQHRAFERDHLEAAVLEAVNHGAGKLLWTVRKDDVEICIWLERTDELVRNEGDLSVVLRVDGEPGAVSSFAFVPTSVLSRNEQTGDPKGATSLLVARSQSVRGEALGRFVAVFPNDSVQMWVLSALSGVARSCDFSYVHGIHESAQIAYKPEFDRGFQRSYSQTWAKMPQAELIGTSIRFSSTFPTPAEAGTLAGNRSRAHRRRRQWEEIRTSARMAMESGEVR